MFYYRQTTCEELYPLDAQSDKKVPRAPEKSMKVENEVEEDFFPRSLENDIMVWSPDDVARCLRIFDLDDLASKKLWGFSI